MLAEELLALAGRADLLRQRLIKIAQRAAFGRGAAHQDLSDRPDIGGKVFARSLQVGSAVDRSVHACCAEPARSVGRKLCSGHGCRLVQPDRIQADRLQRGQEFFGARKPFGRTLRQSLQNNPGQLRGHLRIHFGRRPGRCDANAPR